jgi:hypothetical protein
LTLCLVNNIETENKRNCAAKHIFHYSNMFIIQATGGSMGLRYVLKL